MWIMYLPKRGSFSCLPLVTLKNKIYTRECMNRDEDDRNFGVLFLFAGTVAVAATGLTLQTLKCLPLVVAAAVVVERAAAILRLQSVK